MRIPPRVAQKIVFVLLTASMVIVALPVAGIVIMMIVKGAAGLNPALFLRGSQALLPAIVGTLLLVLLTTLIAAPLGILAAIYLSEYARRGPVVRAVRLAIINLAGVPSVVYGLFGLALFVMMLKFGRCLLSGSATLALHRVLPGVRAGGVRPDRAHLREPGGQADRRLRARPLRIGWHHGQRRHSDPTGFQRGIAPARAAPAAVRGLRGGHA